MSSHDEHRRRDQRLLLEGLKRIASSVRRERRARGDGLVPATLAVLIRRGQSPAWMRISGGSIHPRVSSIGAEQAPVQLDPDAEPLLGHVLASSMGMLGGSRATFAVWLEGGSERVAVQIGTARVGRLDHAPLKRLRPLIYDAERRGLKLIASATLTAAGPLTPPYALTVAVPPA
jgi:hypothetical protein